MRARAISQTAPESPRSVRAKKSLGQHFLRSRAAIAKIVAAADIAPGERVLEVGPGEGVLTEALLAAGARVVAIEKDAELLLKLRERFAGYLEKGTLVLFGGDMLDPSLRRNIFAAAALGAGPYKVAANIPYYITGALLRLFLEEMRQPAAIVFLVQKEVADEIVAKNGKEGILSLSVKAYGDPSLTGKVPRGAFVPPPKVDSAIIRVEHISRERLQGLRDEDFFRVVRAGLGARRKMLLGNLARTLRIPRERLEHVLAELGIPPNARGEDIPIGQWIALATRVTALFP